MTRHADSRLIRFCVEGETWQPQEESCAWDDCSGKRHRVRRMLICSKCEQCYEKRKSFDCHECFDAY